MEKRNRATLIGLVAIALWASIVGLIRGVEQVEQLAEIGVVLLLFAIGIEFSIGTLMRMRRAVLVGGSLQVLGVTLVVYLASLLAGLTHSQGVFLGMIASLSSVSASGDHTSAPSGVLNPGAATPTTSYGSPSSRMVLPMMLWSPAKRRVHSPWPRMARRC